MYKRQIKYFDKEAKPVEKPEFKKPIPEGLTAKIVIDKYIDAIGGAEALEDIKTVLTQVDVSIQGAPFKPTAVIKTMAPNKESMEMSVQGMGTIMTQKFNGKTGYTEQQGNKQEMPESEILKKQKQKGLFAETYLNSEDLVLISLISVNGVDAYKIQVDEENGLFRYYDAKSALLIRTESSQEAQGQKIIQTTDISDYKAVDGVLMPYTKVMTTGPQIITLSASEIKINDGVSKKDFK